jgi:P-type Ca2+ transporter type 2C
VAEARLLEAAAIAAHADGDDPMDLAIRARTPAVVAVATFPFTEGRRCQVGIAMTAAGLRAAVKGAPETVLAMSTLDAGARAHWLEQVAALAGDGHKVIACAEREVADGDRSEPVDGFAFLGLLAFEDPLRPGVATAVAQAQAAGIRVVMISGDHPRTARAIAREIGLGGGEPRVIDGSELEAELAGGRIPDVVARCLPAQKLELVQALQRDGAIVAVTGDGINDVPALRGADVGIAMGERGTRGAREAAAIVLLDDDFASIVQAVAEGRQLFSNLRRSFAFLLVVHVPLVLTAALLPLAGYPLLYLPISIVWLELVIHPVALLAFQQPAGPDALGPPRPRAARFFDRREWGWIAGSGLALAAWVGAAFVLALAAGSVELARSVAFASLLAALIGSAAVLSGLRTAAARYVLLAAVVSTGLLFALPPLSSLLHLQPLPPAGVLVAGAAGALAALLMRGLRGGG